MSALSTIQTGKKKQSICVLLYGVHGIGKSSFATESPNPIFLGSEDNSELDAARFPIVKRWADLEAALKALRDEPHDFKTLVIDTIDTLQDVAQIEILSKEPGKNMATACGGFGKAYDQMQSMFLKMREDYLKPIRQKGMNIVILCHAQKSKHEDPITASSWDSYQTSMHKKVQPIFQDWVSAILFAQYRLAKAATDEGKSYVVGDGRRVLYTEERPSHVAKNRFSLPETMEFKRGETWKALSDKIDEFFDVAGKNGELLAEAKELLKSMPEDIKPTIVKSIEAAKADAKELSRIIDKMLGFKQK